MQLVAYGAQDVYLTGNPQITFFKIVYRRHTNFSMEAIQQQFNGNAGFGKKVSCTISRNGDLIHRIYMQAKVGSLTSEANHSTRWLNWLGHLVIKDVELEIGGQAIDKHYGDWMHIWNELTQRPGLQQGYATMVGNVPRMTMVHSTGNATRGITDGSTQDDYHLYVPLQFWFCRNPGLALPLIALQYHEVKINMTFRDFDECYFNIGNNDPAVQDGTFVHVTPPTFTPSLYVDYIYLDTEERRRFAQVSHEYLIEQVQFTGAESVTEGTSNKVKLNFNHPVKELVWVMQRTDVKCDQNTSDAAGTGAGHYGAQPFNFTTAWDQSPFTGTPEGPYGTGMADADTLSLILGDAGDSWGNKRLTTGDATQLTKVYLHDTGKNFTKSAKVILNGHDRFSERPGSYFNYVQPYQHHTCVPAEGINVYSFGLEPEEHQPSGTCNFSRIDNATLLVDVETTNAPDVEIRVYATNYNVLRIMSGMGGLAYSN